MNNVDTIPKCPHCGDVVSYENESNRYYEGNSFVVVWEGYCLHCQRTYTFTETFELTERSSLDEKN